MFGANSETRLSQGKSKPSLAWDEKNRRQARVPNHRSCAWLARLPKYYQSLVCRAGGGLRRLRRPLAAPHCLPSNGVLTTYLGSAVNCLIPAAGHPRGGGGGGRNQRSSSRSTSRRCAW